MHAFASPPRRRRAAIVSLLAVALLAIAAWTATRAWVEPAPAAATHASLTALDDLAAAAEARIMLASLRAALDAPRSGAGTAQARRALAVIGAALEARRERSERWEEPSATLERVSALAQTGDAAVRETIVELEEALRTFSP